MSSAAAFNAVGELSLLGRSGTVAFLDFSILKVMVSSSALQLEMCYGVVTLSYLLSTKTYLSAKIAASSIATGPCSNSPLTLTCGSSPRHYQRASPAVALPWLPAKSSATCLKVLRLPSPSLRHALYSLCNLVRWALLSFLPDVMVSLLSLMKPFKSLLVFERFSTNIL